jgi:hypothetical protein
VPVPEDLPLVRARVRAGSAAQVAGSPTAYRTKTSRQCAARRSRMGLGDCMRGSR